MLSDMRQRRIRPFILLVRPCHSWRARVEQRRDPLHYKTYLKLGKVMELKDEVDKAVDDLFGKYTVKEKEVAKENKEIPLVQDQQHEIPPPDKTEVDQIKQLTSLMLKRLSMAVKSDSWGHRLYYSYQFVQIAMNIANRITRRK
jgi:hypothetical protein